MLSQLKMDSYVILNAVLTAVAGEEVTTSVMAVSTMPLGSNVCPTAQW